MRQTVSVPTERDATDWWVMTAGLFLLGFGYVVTAVGLREAGTAGRMLLSVGGVATAMTAVFPQPRLPHASR